MSQRFDLYVARDSWLHRADPRVKLWAVLAAAAAGLMFKHILVLALLLVAAHGILLLARIPASSLRWLWARLLPLLVMILILQPLVTPGPGPDLAHVGPLRLTLPGILEGISFALRTAALAFVVAVLLLSTQSTKIVQGLVKLGLPYSWGLTVGLAIRYLPTTYGLFVSITEAQQARGWMLHRGGLVRRVRAYLPILVATIIAALRLSDSLGLALGARGLGYAARRTELHGLWFSRGDWIASVAVFLVLVGLVVLRLGLGFGGQPW